MPPAAAGDSRTGTARSAAPSNRRGRAPAAARRAPRGLRSTVVLQLDRARLDALGGGFGRAVLDDHALALLEDDLGELIVLDLEAGGQAVDARRRGLVLGRLEDVERRHLGARFGGQRVRPRRGLAA